MNRQKRNDKDSILRTTETKEYRQHTGNDYRLQSGMELTGEGWLFCVMAGILETVSVLAICRIELTHVPLLVFLVLWAAFGIITSSLLAVTGYYLVYYRKRSTEICAAVKQNSFSVPDQMEIWNMKKVS